MAEAYYTQDRNPSPDRPERRSVSRKTVIEAAKETVPVIDLADRLCGPDGWRKVGDRRVCRCPLPGHDERTPSFTVFLETNSWYCFGACQRGGDVVELAAAAWGYRDSEMAMAAALLLHEFGHPIPERKASWFRKQERQKPIRSALGKIRFNSQRRRLFRLLEPMLSGIEDQTEREREAEFIWREITPLAVRLIEERRLEKGRAT